MEKILIVTGASSGIGHEIAALFQSNNWRVINISRRPSSIKNSLSINIDLSHPDFEQRLRAEFETILVSQTRICLVHNASSHLNDTVMEQDPIKLAQSLNVSVVSPSIINRILIPYMAQLSSIIYIGSTLSEKAVPGAASYVINKHAVAGMMRATCQDLAGKNIHTACICPGFTNTQMLQQHLAHDPTMLEFAKQKVGAQRLIEPHEIAELIYFSAQNPVLNGSLIHANLGQKET